MIETLMFIIIGIVLGLLFAVAYFRSKVELMGRKLGAEIGKIIFEERKGDLEALFEGKYKAELERWRVECEAGLRRDALDRSRSVLKGKLAEQLAPMFDAFGYQPSDARFLGDPVDYVIFDGYTKARERLDDRPITVVLADVKTGEAGLTYEQRRVRDGVERGMVRFETIRM